MRSTYLILFFSLIAIVSCNNKSNQNLDSQSQRSTTQPSDNTMSQYGIKDSDKNVLGGLQVGELAPDFELKKNDGYPESLSNLLVRGDVLLVFYRGEWCPICNRHLAALQSELEVLTKSGIQVYAISGEQAQYANELIEKENIEFPVFIDSDYEVMKKYKVLFEVSDAYVDKVKTRLEKDIAVANGGEVAMLPIPATYLIGQDRKIKYAHYDPNYRSRSTTAEILNAL